MIRFPDTVRFLLTDSSDATDPPSVKDLQTAVAPIVGWLPPVKLASPIIASTVEVGTPLLQLDAVAQLVLVVPFQLVWEKMALLHNNNIPIRSQGFG